MKVPIPSGAALLPAVAYAFSHGAPTIDVNGARVAMLAGAVVAALATLVAWHDRQASGQRVSQTDRKNYLTGTDRRVTVSV
jgi:hypothetical protein